MDGCGEVPDCCIEFEDSPTGELVVKLRYSSGELGAGVVVVVVVKVVVVVVVVVVAGVAAVVALVGRRF